MPSRPFTAADLDESELFRGAAYALMRSDDSDAEDMAFLLQVAAVEPLVKRSRQEVGKARLSLERLQGKRQRAAGSTRTNNVSQNVYDRFGFHLNHLKVVVQRLQVPQKVRLGKDHYTGEECVLLMLRRLRTPGSLLSLTYECSRYSGQISKAANWAVRFIRYRCACAAPRPIAIPT